MVLVADAFGLVVTFSSAYKTSPASRENVTAATRLENGIRIGDLVYGRLDDR
jgi:hypothetical protein